jgi:chromate reductase
LSQLRILGISGSLRSGSLNSGLLRAAQELAPDEVEIEIFDLKDIPLFNGDIEAAGRPDAVLLMQERIVAVDALLFSTPEYNGSYSGVLKNAIDWASRQYEKPVFAEKPVAMMGAGGRFGTARSQSDLRQLLTGQGCCVLPRPQVLVSIRPNVFELDGTLADEDTRTSIAALVEALAVWTRRLRPD